VFKQKESWEYITFEDEGKSPIEYQELSSSAF
jgi:UDP-3-O-[3-hydroxymyristoyl] N-acetylglucosamine deacetylase